MDNRVMAMPLKIDFVSDVSCPWCIIGLQGLEQALENIGDAVEVDIHFQPFELNPQMPAGGQNLTEHIAQKYGSTREQMKATREMIRSRAAGVGFTIAMSDESRIYNTFDAHRLLHWADLQGRQKELKHILFETYFERGLSPADHEVLVSAAEQAGLDPAEARDVLSSGRFSDEVRGAEELWRSRGISSVPAIVINDRYLISGGQPVEVFERAVREIAAGP